MEKTKPPQCEARWAVGVRSPKGVSPHYEVRLAIRCLFLQGHRGRHRMMVGDLETWWRLRPVLPPKESA